MWSINIIPSRENPQVVITYPQGDTYVYDVTYGVVEELNHRLPYIEQLPEGAKEKQYGRIAKWVREKAFGVHRPSYKEKEKEDEQLEFKFGRKLFI